MNCAQESSQSISKLNEIVQYRRTRIKKLKIINATTPILIVFITLT